MNVSIYRQLENHLHLLMKILDFLQINELTYLIMIRERRLIIENSFLPFHFGEKLCQSIAAVFCLIPD